jgi:D-alanyl-lipoteichoic acid acyltransferase DltB (MBOAT superfamily)
MLWGFFKKCVVADRLAHVVDVVYASPSSWAGPALVIATVAFAFQIYADFSGYSDIAIGAAAVMGIQLMTNFRQPYFSRSVTEFWTRWHISLSTWFRDYLYVPLGGNRRGPWRTRANLLVTFLVSGLWHGANWTFVAWGGLNGVYLVIERTFGLDKPRSSWRIGLTFVLVLATWVFFRAATLDDAAEVFIGLGRDVELWWSPAALLTAFDHAEVEWYKLLVAALAVIVLLLVDQRLWRHGVDAARWLQRWPTLPRWGFYYAAGGAIAVLGSYGAQEFIYFQF